MITAKKVKRKCNVRGCRHTDSYSISHYREGGNTVIICKDCLKDALAAIEGPEGTIPPKELGDVTEELGDIIDGEPVKQEDGLICPKCGREYKSEPAYKKHIEKCGG